MIGPRQPAAACGESLPMRRLFLLLACLALLLPFAACGGSGYDTVEECICDDFGCDCVVYEEDPLFFKGSPAYADTW